MQEHEIAENLEAKSPKDEDLTAEPNYCDGAYANENEGNMLVVKNFVSAHSKDFRAPDSMAVSGTGKTLHREPTVVVASSPFNFDAKTTLNELPPTEYQ